MPNWLKIFKSGFKSENREKKEIKELWIKCPECEATLYKNSLKKNLWVCPHCDEHLRIRANQYIDIISDKNSFKETNKNLKSKDVLKFKDKKKYSDRIKEHQEKSGINEAVVTGTCLIDNQKVSLSVMDFKFMGGSMGSVVGEKLSQAIQLGIKEEIPVIILSASGGARMQESILSLMQMAKTSAYLAKLSEKGLPFISVITNPTYGGITASFASLGDVIIAEPKALIGFAGPRVIKETIRQELPDGFQRSEFLQDHGFVDVISPRKELKNTISKFISYYFIGNK